MYFDRTLTAYFIKIKIWKQHPLKKEKLHIAYTPVILLDPSGNFNTTTISKKTMELLGRPGVTGCAIDGLR
jgi:hypothetical protein